MNVTQWIQLVSNVGVMPTLIIALFYALNKRHDEQIKQYQTREDRLMNHLDSTRQTNEKIAITLEKLEMRLEAIEDKVKE